MSHIKPIRTAETQIITNDYGITVKVIERFRQGKRFYRVILLVDENGEMTDECYVEDEPETTWRVVQDSHGFLENEKNEL